jgi:type VI secretion system protein ImpE
MTAQELYKAGRLKEAIAALGAEVRDRPADAQRRTFLFELLCFAGELERAQKHLNVLAQNGPEAEVGALLYRSALAAETIRQSLFSGPSAAGMQAPPPAGGGTLNGKPFNTIEDADPRIGARLEVFIAGEYVLMPFTTIGSLRIPPPQKLRDLMWTRGDLVAAPSYKGKELGEVLLPVLYPLSWKHASDEVKLGRTTEWETGEGETPVPYGHRLLLVDGEEVVPFLEVRELIFTPSAGAAS